jgi:phosphatidylserine/phosphatidylglycerophosphate/cardiolipin synthase-like enzyme
VGYVGGIDLSTFQGDRWDTREHPLRFGPNWHDAQMRLEGEVVRDVEENFCQRWNAVTGDRLAPLDSPGLDPSWTTPAQIVRTVPAGFYPFAPEGEYGIRHALLAAIRQAERYIHLENQYIWDPEIVEALIAAMNRPHSGPFRIVLILPAHAYTGKYDNDEHVRLLHDTDGGRGIFHAYSLYATGPAFGSSGYRYLPIYVHGKVSIVDDAWVSVGSANLNRRGLATDTEMNVQAMAPEVARALRIHLMAEHLGMPEEAVAAVDPIHLIDQESRLTAERLTDRLRRGEPPPAGHLYPYIPGSNPGSRLLDLMQDLTLEH